MPTEEKDSILHLSKCVNVICSMGIKKDDKFLMVEEAKEGIEGLWNFPSGKVKMGETLTDSAVREVFEESCYRSKVTGLLGVYYYQWEEGPGVSIRFSFIGEVIEDNPSGVLHEDIRSVAWKTKEEIQELIKRGKLRSKMTIRMAENLFDGKNYPLDTLS